MIPRVFLGCLPGGGDACVNHHVSRNKVSERLGVTVKDMEKPNSCSDYHLESYQRLAVAQQTIGTYRFSIRII